jgi:hypothetical protein
LSGKFINFKTDWAPEPHKKIKAEKVESTADAKTNESMADSSTNHFSHYFEPMVAEESGPQKILYTVSIHRSICTDEFFDLYKRYELAVHGKEREPKHVNTFLCNSPVFDPERDIEFA